MPMYVKALVAVSEKVLGSTFWGSDAGVQTLGLVEGFHGFAIFATVGVSIRVGIRVASHD